MDIPRTARGLEPELTARGLSTKGKKEALQQRLREALDGGTLSDGAIDGGVDNGATSLAALELYARARLLLAAVALAKHPPPPSTLDPLLPPSSESTPPALDRARARVVAEGTADRAPTNGTGRRTAGCRSVCLPSAVI